MSGYSTALLTGLAAHLAAGGVGVWKPTGIYAAGETGIVLSTVPQQPDRIITLSLYPVTDEPALSDSVLALQVRTRSAGQDPRDLEDLADSIYDLLHGRTHLELSTGPHIVQVLRQSGVLLGQDANLRWERSDNYYLTLHRPSTHRT